ncbi:MAG: MoxR family ATPase [Candidatus Marinimicrobia bacterium]|jgi:MoxR-like ATPase|nr:ATPase [Candidatus Neomarinimicrobiota bacterium]MDP6457561.1 MoxR family ATPase [Candidatus Neomarinimicrobiota bacterium]MDP6592752.1 MoxR family ATPase [Candidatus Neomarinimicrobiota bacterium]MDP6837217.1 MoxR family ATPase [Candidatus Neomarinimicrobiota bacterium]MDP6966379.1 MoxR family ATPase [Candidatus Neomarinimicrobiota bacterium]|tara:strand:- start:2820 stop:3740 length:921 start_codon:yes stop_codon:yes gene_type:complete
MTKKKLQSVDAVQEWLNDHDYIADRSLATSIYLMLKMEKPLFLEGEPGVGKTEVGKVLSQMLGTELIRLQCYEGLDVHNAVYEWNYSRQILQIRLMEAAGEKDRETITHEIFGPDFLIQRPLLKAVDNHAASPPVLLIDELDRADEEFEAFLLEILSDFQVTIPEIGTVVAKKKPKVVITSNRTREIHDALKRRCLYHWIAYPSSEREFEIVQRKIPKINESLGKQVVAFVQALREMDIYKLPGIAETLDWSNALIKLGTKALTSQITEDTLGTLLKYQDDIEKVNGEVTHGLVQRAIAEADLIPS